MPVARPRDEARVVHVIVRRTGVDGKEEDSDLGIGHTPTTTIDQILDSSNYRRQLDVSSLDFGRPDTKEAEKDDDRPDRTPTPWLITMTIPQPRATGGALPDNKPMETVVVAINPPPRDRPDRHRGRTTEHLLIAAGSIGATIIIVMIALAIYTMRKRGLTLRDAVQRGKYQVTRRGPQPPPKSENLDSKQPYNDYKTMQNDMVTPPQPAMSIPRSSSISSQQPLVGLQRNDSFNARQMAERTAVPPVVPQNFLLDAASHSLPRSRNNSQTPSSTVLPLQIQRNSESTRRTRSMSDAPVLRFPEPAADRTLSPLPPPPTFKQFLFNRPSISGRPGPNNTVSRFSWTNSNAPQTPHDPHRDTNINSQLGRDSFVTTRSSVPRFRTVDSWVTQQTNRITEQKLRDQFRLTQTSTVSAGDDIDTTNMDAIPAVPQLPHGVTPAQYSPVIPRKPLRTLSNAAGLPGKNVRHQRHTTHTSVGTAPIFRQHPGTEVRFSMRSAVPTEVLDLERRDRILS